MLLTVRLTALVLFRLYKGLWLYAGITDLIAAVKAVAASSTVFVLIVLLSLLMIVGLYLLFRFMRPERLVNPDAFFSVMQYLNSLRTPQSPYLPTQWITKILWEGLKSSPWGNTFFEILLTWSTAGVLFVINILVAKKIYFQGSHAQCVS